MPYARTPEAVKEQRERVALHPPRREANGQRQREKTRSGREQNRARQERESEEEAMRVALNHPHRRDLPKHRYDDDGRKVAIHPRDERAGHALGRLYLTNAVTGDQYRAGLRYTELALRHMQHITGHLPRFQCQAINDVIKGLPCTKDMSDDDVFALRRAWNDAQRAIADTHEQHAVVSALASVCLMDRDPSSDAVIGALRVGCNALHRLWA